MPPDAELQKGYELEDMGRQDLTGVGNGEVVTPILIILRPAIDHCRLSRRCQPTVLALESGPVDDPLWDLTCETLDVFFWGCVGSKQGEAVFEGLGIEHLAWSG